VEALYRPSPETIQRSDNFPTSSTNNVAAAHLITSAISAGTHCIINPVSIHHSIELLFGRGNQSSDVLSLHASNLAPLWQVSVVKKWKLANTVCALGFRKLHATHMACHCGDESQVFQYSSFSQASNLINISNTFSELSRAGRDAKLFSPSCQKKIKGNGTKSMTFLEVHHVDLIPHSVRY
jgi:hypothetical protein